MRLLIAEDEIQLAEALHEILIMNKYSVDVVHNGRDAIDYMEAISYDGIILDIMMPKIDGITVLKTIREQKNTTPVLLLTAKGELDDKVLGLDCGADDYLTKPFATKELLARIRAMTRREKLMSETNLKYGNVVLNRVNYSLCVLENQVTLTNKEYQLIEMLFRGVGKYITSERFMEQIWGFDSDSEINVVWAHISSLRKKLDQMNANIMIKSSRNLGYTLEELHDQ